MKQCRVCKEWKDLSEFHPCYRKKDSRAWCKFCANEWQKAYGKKTGHAALYRWRLKNLEKVRENHRKSYRKNREKILGRQAIQGKGYRKARREKWILFLKTFLELRCLKCGYNKTFSALDFHHKGQKKTIISVLISRLGFTEANKAIVKEEVNKCEVLCANCHRELEHND